MTMPHQSVEAQHIQRFCNEHFPGLELLPPMMEQLLWIQANTVNTSHSNTRMDVATIDINIEVKRTLTRLFCMTLLIKGDDSAYQQFTAAQLETVTLSREKFKQLSDFIQRLSPTSQQCLLATCFITKSDKAEALAKKEWPAGKVLSTDSEQFITDVVTHRASLFPICELLDSDALNLFPFAFYENAHLRHMLDMEGGYNMLHSIKEGIQNGKITREQLDLWFARWMINIAGLDGHVENSKGSMYLTEPVAQCIFALKAELEQLWNNPGHPVVDNYLAFRAAQLNVTTPYIAYLGALMRRYTPAIGQEIQQWFDALSPQTQAEYLAAFDRQLKTTKVTSTFKPTILVTLLDLGCSVSEALTLFSHIELHAMQVYNQGVQEGIIPEKTPLCYRDTAFKDSLLFIRDLYRLCGKLPIIDINAKGQITPRPSSIYIAGNWLNLNKKQTVMLVKHWYLAGLLEKGYFSSTLRYLQVPEKQIEHILHVLNNCISDEPGISDNDRFNAEKFCNLFYPDDERFVVIALALFEYFQQNHFSKGEHKEASMAVCTTYTREHKESIEQMAKTFNLIEEVKLANDADITLIIGGRSKTNQVYLNRYQLERASHQLGVAYVFLSTRKLLPDENLSAKEMVDVFKLPSAKAGDYFTYLREEYLTKYNDYLSAQLGKRVEMTELTEGLALFERCDFFRRQDPSFTPEFVYTETPNSDDFYPKAIQRALTQGHLPACEGTIAVSSIQPYIQKYADTVRNLFGGTVYGYGPTGVSKPETLVLATAMLIDTNYSAAARAVVQRLAIEAFPVIGLRRISRDKQTQLQLPESYLAFIAPADIPPVAIVVDVVDASNITRIELVIKKLHVKSEQLDARTFSNAGMALNAVCEKLTIVKNNKALHASERMAAVNTILRDALNNPILTTHRPGIKQLLVRCLTFLGLMPSMKPENEIGFFGRGLRKMIGTDTANQLMESRELLRNDSITP